MIVRGVAIAVVVAAFWPLSVPAQQSPPKNPCERLCSQNGRCASVGSTCVAKSDADCQQSVRCRMHGECTFRDGRCLTGKNDCSGSEACTEYGACTWMRGVCRTSCDDAAALKTAHESDELISCSRDAETRCTETVGCVQYGLCGSGTAESCELSVDGCAGLPGCAERGACSSLELFCGARTNAECQNSRACKEAGTCSAYEFECIGPAEIRERCGGDGWIIHERQCVRPPGYDCAEECKTKNRCDAHAFDGYVVCIETAKYCQSQPACKQSGWCKAHVKSWYSYNKCQYADESLCGEWVYGGCIKSEADCANSVGCTKSGNCSAASPSQYCRPTKARHCAQSQICKKEGQCKLLDESSYFICGD